MHEINSAKLVRELEAAGLLGEAFSWGEDGSLFFPSNMDPATRTKIEALIEAHDPTPEQAAPLEVTKRQATQALILAGLDEQVEAMLAAMPGVAGKLARAEWRECNTVRRDRPLVLQMAQALGITDAQLDELFNTAEGLS